MNKRKAIITAILSALITTGCLVEQKRSGAILASSSHSEQVNAGSCDNGGGALGAFQSTFFPLARVNCIGCHGSTQSPLFAVSDASDAFNVAQNYIYYDRVNLSPYVTKLKDGHCGPQCVAGSAPSNAMITALSNWAAGANSAVACPTPTTSPTASPGGATAPTDTSNLDINPYVTAAIPLPASIPDTQTDTYAIMRWDLGTVTPRDPNLSGVILEIKVQKVGLNGYVFRLPRLATKNYPIYIKNLQILINGTYDRLGNLMSDVDNTVNNVPNYTIPAITTQMNPFPALSSKNVILSQINGPSTDKISLAFEEIRKADAPATCKALATFQAKVLPQFSMPLPPYNPPKCLRCHQSGIYGNSPEAVAAFDMTNYTNAAAMCAQALQRMNKYDPAQSVFISDPLNRTNGHPSTYYYDSPGLRASDVFPAFTDWLNEEIANGGI
jgi:hypothetical protein